MNQIPTAMRAAFRAAFNQRHPVADDSKPAALVDRALKTRAGLTTRKTMWSVQRGNR